MTIAQELRQEGRAEGLRTGRAEGLRTGRAEGLRTGRREGREATQRETLLHLLARRFGPVPAGIRRRVMAAGSAELRIWLDRTIDAPALKAVFAPSH